MDEMLCDDCGIHLGYAVDAGPRGSRVCDDCYYEHLEDEATQPSEEG